MKLFVVLAACAALCAGHVVPTIPGDNSHYVEGESRYIWMPNGDGEPVLVDLHEPVDTRALNDFTRNGANNQYWLFTRSNPTNAQIITNGNANSISNSNFVAGRQTKVVVHGWNSNGNSGINPLITSAFLAVGDVNVIVLDWRALANSAYTTAANGVPGVGQFACTFLNWLVAQTGTNWNNIHLVGFSLGAHVVGNIGRACGNRPRRITGLDPAGPNWGANSQRLRASDGQYVESIHTDRGLLGITDALGNAAFYPNGGNNPQPGCWISTCSHSRSYEFFAATVRNNHLVGRQCSNQNAAMSTTVCTGSNFNMGNAIIGKSGNGFYNLNTGNSFPF